MTFRKITKQTKVLPVRVSERTYLKFRDLSESMGVSPSVYLKSFIINEIRRFKAGGFGELLDSLPGSSESEGELMEYVNKQVDRYRKSKNKCIE